MIDEGTLNRWERMMSAAITGTFPADDACELIRLARLGLWAKKHAIPDIRGAIAYDPMIDCYKLKQWHEYHFQRALAALPKGGAT